MKERSIGNFKTKKVVRTIDSNDRGRTNGEGTLNSRKIL
jgi:hypothetical protein